MARAKTDMLSTIETYLATASDDTVQLIAGRISAVAKARLNLRTPASKKVRNPRTVRPVIQETPVLTNSVERGR